MNKTTNIIEVDNLNNHIIKSEDVFIPLGETNEDLKHQSSDIINQHPIESVSTLRQELDNIQLIKTNYTNKKNYANYYLWDDENLNEEERNGYFVSCNTLNNIQISNSNNIFGVTIDSTGFIGGENEVQRDYKYGLVAYNGAIPVRCESNILVGDYVTSNENGIAKKADGNYGYEVIELQKNNEIDYAIILLEINTNQFNNNTIQLNNMKKDVYNIENSIISTINTTSDITQNINKMTNISENTILDANAALNVSQEIFSRIDTQISNILSINENANQTKNDANNIIENIQDITNNVSIIVEDASNKTNDTKNKTNSLNNDLIPISIDVSEFISDVNSNSSRINLLSEWKTQNENNIENIATIKNQVNNNESNLLAISTWKNNVNSDISNISAVSSKTNNTESNITNFTNWKSDTTNSLSITENKSNNTESSISSFNTFKDQASAISSVISKVNQNESSITTLNSWENDSNISLVEIEERSDKNNANIKNLIFNIDNYSVGEASQANGLSVLQATNLLKTDMIYVPTVNHDESYLNNDNITYTTIGFSKGKNYQWNGTQWIESSTDTVYFQQGYVVPSQNYIYWFTEGGSTADEYKANTLYLWKNNKWIAIATLSGNINTRKSSIINQSLDNISTEVSNAHGSLTSLGLNIDSQESKITQMVENVGTDGTINIASIISAVNNGSSSIQLAGKNIILDGDVTATEDFNLIGGDIYLSSGKKIISNEGLYSHLQFINSGSTGFVYYGFDYSFFDINYLTIDVLIPNNFNPQKMIITLIHYPLSINDTYFVDGTYGPEPYPYSTTGYAHNLAFYKNVNSTIAYILLNSADGGTGQFSGTELTDVFGNNGWTATNLSGKSSVSVELPIVEGSPYLVRGFNRFGVATKNPTLSSLTAPSNVNDYVAKCASTWSDITVIIDVYGYITP